MSFLRGALERRADVVDLADTYGQPGFGSWAEGMRWQPTLGTGAEGAMRLSAVYACLRLLSEAIATLPLDTFTRGNGTRRPFRPRPDYLSFQLPHQPRSEYLSQVVLSLLTDGNAFVATPRNRLGEPTALVPLDPTVVTVDRLRDGPRKGDLVFRAGALPGEYSELDIMHIKGMSLPGRLRGVSPITAAREVLGAAADAQAFGANLFKNHAVPPAVIEVPGVGGPEDKTRARAIAETWHETHGGTSSAGKIGVLVGGAKLSTVAVTPEDAQWLDTRRFGVQEVARIYGVPPHLIADSSNSTSWGSGLAEQNLAFGQFSLRPWLERIEEAHARLLTTHGLPDVFVKLNLDALLRASLADRYASYGVGIRNGFLSANDVRALEDLPPVPNGDVYLTHPTGSAPPANAPPSQEAPA